MKSSAHNKPCPHTDPCDGQGLVLLALKSDNGSDDDLTGQLCNQLAEHLENVCLFALPSSSEYVAEALSGHKAAVILAASSGLASSGTMTVYDLTYLLSCGADVADVDCPQAQSLLQSLRCISPERLPKRIIFLSLMVNVEGTAIRSSQHIVGRLSSLVRRVLETLARAA